MNDSNNAFATLESEYCPPLDPALLSAILSDYDLGIESNVSEARAILDSLKESADFEEQQGFDASGTGAQAQETTKVPEVCPDLTSISTALSSTDLGSSSTDDSEDVTGTTALEVESSSEEAKIQLLEQMVDKRLSRSKIEYTLRKCGGNFHRAVDELLSQVYFDEAEDSEDGSKYTTKGIDGFSEDKVFRKSRKGKGRRRGPKSLSDESRTSSLPGSPGEPAGPVSNAWTSSNQDIDFITSRTGVATATVSSIYYSTGASLPKTIGAVLKTHLAKGQAALEEEPIMAVNAHELGSEFPSIAKDYVAALISLTYPSTANAHEMAKALTAPPPPSSTGGIQIIPRYGRPIDLESDWQSATAKKTKSSIGNVYADMEPSGAAELASGYAAARSAALAQAYAAHRRAKSDRLMGGAAAYYGGLSRELATKSLRASAAAADELASQQSSPSQLDLHGIDVLNGVRIAQEKVNQWWDGLGENRANGRLGAQDRHTGYRIVVGRGTHSEGGRSKLGPAVTKMLNNEGWKSEPAGAAIIVRGKMRR